MYLKLNAMRRVLILLILFCIFGNFVWYKLSTSNVNFLISTVTCVLLHVVPLYTQDHSYTSLEVISTPQGYSFTLRKMDGCLILNGHVAPNTSFKQTGSCVEFTTNGTSSNDTFEDCLELGCSHWFGGPEQSRQYWPIENFKFKEYSFVTKQEDNQGVAEPYWLSSNGVYIYVYPGAPLFIDMNNKADKQLCFIARSKLPYPTEIVPELRVRICSYENAKVAHEHAIKDILGKPSGIPDERMMQYPIWSTWAKYKAKVNETVIMKYAEDILTHGFENNQLEIDDMWEVCYGSLTFNETKFPNIKNIVSKLKAKGFRVTLWVHPFININCDPWHKEATEKGYLIRNVTNPNSTLTVWWNGNASAVDMTNPSAVKWYVDRLMELKANSGIDGYKFDAGETGWLPQPPMLNVDPNISPSKYTEEYVRAVTKFGRIVEVRVAQHTQDLPNFVRMLDKDTGWDFNNGIKTLITTLLQMNLVGYPLVLPDMIGGNAYHGNPSKELFIRWTQANVFMPSMQYSFVPWDFDNETVQICRNYTQLHTQYANKIIELAKKATVDGSPINPPIWWIDPTDETAQTINSEFLLGEEILVAPVLDEGATSRDIYLPKGKWKDQLRNKIILGPTWLKNYTVALHELAYFISEGSQLVAMNLLMLLFAFCGNAILIS